MRNNVDFIRMYNDGREIKEIFNTMPTESFKVVNIQNSPDNPYNGNVYYCLVHKITNTWGTIIGYSLKYQNRKIKTVAGGTWSDWENL